MGDVGVCRKPLTDGFFETTLAQAMDQAHLAMIAEEGIVQESGSGDTAA